MLYDTVYFYIWTHFLISETPTESAKEVTVADCNYPTKPTGTFLNYYFIDDLGCPENLE